MEGTNKTKKFYIDGNEIKNTLFELQISINKFVDENPVFSPEIKKQIIDTSAIKDEYEKRKEQEAQQKAEEERKAKEAVNAAAREKAEEKAEEERKAREASNAAAREKAEEERKAKEAANAAAREKAEEERKAREASNAAAREKAEEEAEKIYTQFEDILRLSVNIKNNIAALITKIKTDSSNINDAVKHVTDVLIKDIERKYIDAKTDFLNNKLVESDRHITRSNELIQIIKDSHKDNNILLNSMSDSIKNIQDEIDKIKIISLDDLLNLVKTKVKDPDIKFNTIIVSINQNIKENDDNLVIANQEKDKLSKILKDIEDPIKEAIRINEETNKYFENETDFINIIKKEIIQTIDLIKNEEEELKKLESAVPATSPGIISKKNGEIFDNKSKLKMLFLKLETKHIEIKENFNYDPKKIFTFMNDLKAKNEKTPGQLLFMLLHLNFNKDKLFVEIPEILFGYEDIDKRIKYDDKVLHKKILVISRDKTHPDKWNTHEDKKIYSELQTFLFDKEGIYNDPTSVIPPYLSPLKKSNIALYKPIIQLVQTLISEIDPLKKGGSYTRKSNRKLKINSTRKH
jgi:hypothetical protein